MDYREIGGELGGTAIGRGFADRRAVRLDAVERPGGRSDTCVNPGNGAAIRLTSAMRRVVGRARGQFTELRGCADQQCVQRQFAAELVQIVEIETERPITLKLYRLPQDLGGDERIAVAVAADPAAHPE